jgi:hypothetical protein
MNALISEHERHGERTTEPIALGELSRFSSTPLHRSAVCSVAALGGKRIRLNREAGMKEPSIFNIDRDSDRKALKALYLACLSQASIDCPSLRYTVQRLLEASIDWRELVRWADDAGYDDRYVRKVLSEILCDLGIRRRQPGAGRVTPEEALAILAAARLEYGERTTKLLGAAHRAAKAQDEQELSSVSPRFEGKAPNS